MTEPTMLQRIESLLDNRPMPTDPQGVVAVMQDAYNVDVATIAIPPSPEDGPTTPAGFTQVAIENLYRTFRRQWAAAQGTTQSMIARRHLRSEGNRRQVMYLGRDHELAEDDHGDAQPHIWRTIPISDVLGTQRDSIRNFRSWFANTTYRQMITTRYPALDTPDVTRTMFMDMFPMVLRESAAITPPAPEDFEEQANSFIDILDIPASVRATLTGGPNTGIIEGFDHSVFVSGGGGMYNDYMCDSRGMAYPLNVQAFAEAIQPTVDQLLALDYTIVSAKVRLRDVPERFELPMFALPPDNDPRAGRYLVVLSNFATDYHVLKYILQGAYFEMLNQMLSTRVVETTDDNLTDEQREMTLLLLQVAAATRSLDENVSNLTERLRRREQELLDMHSTVASITRGVTDDQRQLSHLTEGLRGMALDAVNMTSDLPEMLNNIRQIETAEVRTVRNNLVVSFTTYPFGMRYDNRTLRIPRMTFNLNLLSMSFEQGITVEQGEPHDQYATRVCHPHVHPDGGRICWGNAGIPLADAWGRRDWHSLVRIMLGWVTQYNQHSPYQRWSELRTYVPTIDQTGWLIDNDPLATDTAAEQQEQTA